MIYDLQATLNTQEELDKKHIVAFEAEMEDMTQCYK